MLTETQVQKLASRWIDAWNAHDMNAILDHYADDIVLISPVAAKILNDPDGTVRGREALREYFYKGLKVYPGLKFRLLDLMWGIDSVVLYYLNEENGKKTAELMQINRQGKVFRVIAHYNA